MPPAISDDENSNPDVDERVLAKREKAKVNYTADIDDEDDNDLIIQSDVKGVTNGGAADEDEDDEDDEDLEEDEYVVEKIVDHQLADDGTLKFLVKWEGFEKKSDRTWEPEDNLADNAAVVLEDYCSSLGGRDALFDETAQALKGKKRGRPTAAGASTSSKRSRKNADHPENGEAPASKEAKAWKPPSGSWEYDVEIVDMFRDDATLMVYLAWKNGQKTQHPAQQVYKRAPQKMLAFYESKINFKIGDTDDNTGDKAEESEEEKAI